MGLWDKVQDELNRAGRAAQGALDEGKLRLEIFRVRQLADKSAQALGYAVYRARAKGEPLDDAAWDRLAATLKDHELEAKRLEEQLAQQTTGPVPGAANAGEGATAPPVPKPGDDAGAPASPPGESVPPASGV